MTNKRKPLSRPAVSGLILGLSAIAAIVTSGVGYRLGWWHFTVGLQLSEWATYGAAVATLLSIAALVQTRPNAARRGRVVAILGLLLALLPVGMALQWQYATRAYPEINDISTDTLDAPVFWDMPTPTDYPGAKAAELQRAAYPDLVPLKLQGLSAQAFAYALDVVKDKGWTVVASVPEEGRIEATSSSLLYGFNARQQRGWHVAVHSRDCPHHTREGGKGVNNVDSMAKPAACHSLIPSVVFLAL